MNKAPLAVMKEKFADKEKLVDAIAGIVELGSETKEQLKQRLLAASNTKLLHLHAVAKEIKDKFGSRDKLIDQIIAKQARLKDADYKKRLAGFTPARLLDLYKVAEKKAKGAGAKVAATAAAAKKAVKKAAPAKKAAKAPKAKA